MFFHMLALIREGLRSKPNSTESEADPVFLETTAVAIDLLFEPNGQRRLRLLTQPEASLLNEALCTQSRVTRLGHALFAMNCSVLAMASALIPHRKRLGGDCRRFWHRPSDSEDGGRLGAYAFDGEQHRRGFWRSLLCGQKRIPFALHGLDLLEQELQSIEFAADLSLEMRRQRTAIARSQLLESLPTTATQRFIPSCALRKQQSFDPIDVQDPFVSQHSTLTAQASAVLFLGCGRLDHRAHTRLAALIRQKRAKQRLAVDPVGLSSPAPTRRRDRSGIDNVAFDPFALQNTVNPEAVQSGFLNDDDWERSFTWSTPSARVPKKGCGANVLRSSQAGFREVALDYAARTAFQILGAVLPWHPVYRV